MLSGGSGGCVAACGVARALEEAGIEPQAISVCSGSALWGSMMAAGLSAQEMVDLSLNWQPEDYLDIQWTRLPRFAMAAMRGFTGLAKGEAIERLFDRQLWHMSRRARRRSRSTRSSTTSTRAAWRRSARS